MGETFQIFAWGVGGGGGGWQYGAEFAWEGARGWRPRFILVRNPDYSYVYW